MKLRIGLFLVAGFFALALLRSGAPAGAEKAPSGPLRASAAQFLGASSCSASTCHGGTGPQAAWLSEHTTWIAHDPHARAYDVLLDERSVAIAKHLGIKAAHEEQLCLKCHVLPEYQQGAMDARFRKEDGVGCESCHGPAQRWIDEHYHASWRGKTLVEKQALHMRDTKSPAGRARTCAGCHVGAPGMDVNHDLIAAGHPPLRFEFAAFHANLPRHWDDKKDLTPSKKDPAIDPRGWEDFEARAWVVGQVVSAEAALDLLGDRALSAHRPWPEFAESDCYTCHHNLAPSSWRRERAARGRPLGTMLWNDWYYAMIPALAKGDGAETVAALQRVRRALEKNRPVGKTVATAAAAARHALRAWLPKVERRFEDKGFFKAIQILPAPGDTDVSWFHATQAYLGLAALRQAGAKVPLNATLKDLYNRLQTPESFRPANIDEDLQLLRDLLRK